MRHHDRRSTDLGAEWSAEARPGPQPTRRTTSLAKSTWSYAVIELPAAEQAGELQRVELGILAFDEPNLVRWTPDSPLTALPAGYTILKRYPVDVTDPSVADWERAHTEFAREFPPEAVLPRPVPAWLAPDGRFYACRWLEHDRLSHRLSAALYDDPSGTRLLERRGWVRIQRDGTIIRAPLASTDLSQPQLDVLFSLAQVASGEYRANIEAELELARVRARLDLPRLTDKRE